MISWCIELYFYDVGLVGCLWCASTIYVLNRYSWHVHWVVIGTWLFLHLAIEVLKKNALQKRSFENLKFWEIWLNSIVKAWEWIGFRMTKDCLICAWIQLHPFWGNYKKAIFSNLKMKVIVFFIFVFESFCIMDAMLTLKETLEFFLRMKFEANRVGFNLFKI